MTNTFIKTDNTMNFLKTDDNRIINEKYIRWIKQMDTE